MNLQRQQDISDLNQKFAQGERLELSERQYLIQWYRQTLEHLHPLGEGFLGARSSLRNLIILLENKPT